jgi:cytochrome c oxidase subunit IV
LFEAFFSEVKMTEDTTAAMAHGGAAHGIRRYILVWVALTALTLITVVTGRLDLGAANLALALIIASAKATLVALFFMHLWDSEGVNRLVFAVSVIFVGLLALGVLGDLATRLPTALPGNQGYQDNP